MTRTPDEDRLAVGEPTEDTVEQTADEQALADAGLPQEGRAEPARGRRRLSGLGHRLYNGEAGFDVVGNSRLIYKITAVVLALCLLSIVFRGFNFGIDFRWWAVTSCCCAPAPSTTTPSGP
jgi:preprotein translocase subunit SecF